MDESATQTPVSTVWGVLLTHGLHETTDGLRGGWGWRCDMHPESVGVHGYPTEVTMMLGLREHIEGCPGGG